jgi:hypothetical protein
MSARAMFQSVLFSVAMVGVLSPAYALTEQELTAKLESAGYSQIRDVKSTAEGTVVKAMKNGKEVTLVVDSSGQYQERQEIGNSPAANPPQLTPLQPERSPGKPSNRETRAGNLLRIPISVATGERNSATVTAGARGEWAGCTTKTTRIIVMSAATGGCNAATTEEVITTEGVITMKIDPGLV